MKVLPLAGVVGLNTLLVLALLVAVRHGAAADSAETATPTRPTQAALPATVQPPVTPCLVFILVEPSIPPGALAGRDLHAGGCQLAVFEMAPEEPLRSLSAVFGREIPGVGNDVLEVHFLDLRLPR